MRKYILVHYDNGDTVETSINASVQDIVNIYLDKKTSFSYDDGPETIATARCIEFLDAPLYRPWKGAKFMREPGRVYSVSKKYMKKHGLSSKFRCTFRDWDEWGPWYKTVDCAYIGQDFPVIL